MAQIETRDAFRRRGDQRRVAFGVLGRRVGPVGNQGKMQIAFRAGEVMNLQPFDLLFHGFHACQQGRHRDERAQMRGNPVAQLQRRQKRRREAEVDPAIDQRDGGVDGGNCAEDAKQAENGQAGSGRGEARAAAPQEGSRRRQQSPSRSRRVQAIG